MASLENGDGAGAAGYVNQATADYAACLAEAGLTVVPEDDARAAELTGYAKIDGATFLLTSSGSTDPNGLRIAIDGEDRDAEIRGCREKHPGSKDVLIDQGDFVPLPPEPIPADEIEAGRAWAECARAAGVSVIGDPDELGYVTIPAEVTLAQAEELGRMCSAPMADDEFWPQFHYSAGVLNPTTGMLEIDQYARAIDGPFLDSPRARAAQEDAQASDG